MEPDKGTRYSSADCAQQTTSSHKTGQQPSKLLYKYMTLERFFGSFKDYLDGKAYFAAPESLNDPMESIPIKRRVNWASAGNISAEVFAELDRYKICSLSTRCDNMAMWSYYAKDHTGVCIGFEIDALLLEQHRIKCMEVSYADNYIPTVSIKDQKDISGDISDTLRELFCRKLEDWKYEAEYRLITSLTRQRCYR